MANMLLGVLILKKRYVLVMSLVMFTECLSWNIFITLIATVNNVCIVCDTQYHHRSMSCFLKVPLAEVFCSSHDHSWNFNFYDCFCTTIG